MNAHSPTIIFLLGAFCGGLATWLLSGLFNATAILARDREDKLLASVKEMQHALLVLIDAGIITGQGGEYGDMVARADWVLRYCDEAK